MTKPLRRIFLIASVVLLFPTWAYSGNNETDGKGPRITQIMLAAATSSGTLPGTYAFSVQVEACLEKKSALEKMSELRGKGYGAYVFQAQDSNNQTWYAVRIGDYETVDKASQAATLYREQENQPAVVTYSDSLLNVGADDAASGVSVGPHGTHQRSPGKIITADTDLDGDESEFVPVEPVESPRSATADSMAGAAQAIDEPPSPETNEFEQVELVDVQAADNRAAFAGGAESRLAEAPGLKELREQLQLLQEEVMKLQLEAEARRALKITDEEAAEKEREILEAVSREYTLAKKGTIGLNYSFGYSYNSYDSIADAYVVEHSANHNIRNSISARYALRDNLTVNTSIPFIYKYNRVGTSSSQTVTDFGDVSLGWQWQPMKVTGRQSPPIVSGSITLPLGRSPYKVMPGELSTGSGFYGAGAGVSLSRKIDPMVAFGSLSCSYSLPLTGMDQRRDKLRLNEVHPGMGFGLGFGVGYALSYNANMNLSFSYSYSLGTKYVYNNGLYEEETGTGASASLRIGTGWRVTPSRRINVSLGIPLTGGTDFSVSVSTPLDINLRGQ